MSAEDDPSEVIAGPRDGCLDAPRREDLHRDEDDFAAAVRPASADVDRLNAIARRRNGSRVHRQLEVGGSARCEALADRIRR